MGVYWQIFNITLGKVMPVHDGGKHCEKGLSIDALFYLLQNDWKNSQIVMIGDHDKSQESVDYAYKFLEHYNMGYLDKSRPEIINNLQIMAMESLLPQKAYESSFCSSYLNMEVMAKIELFLSSRQKNIDMFQVIYFVPNIYKKIEDTNLILWTTIPTNDVYLLFDHDRKEYVQFDDAFFRGFFNILQKRPLSMTLVKYNPVMKNVLLGLITHKSEYPYTWHGRFAGHTLSFEKKSDAAEKAEEYTNISNIFTNKKELYSEYFDNVIYIG
jgi:hypothetical protein